MILPCSPHERSDNAVTDPAASLGASLEASDPGPTVDRQKMSRDVRQTSSIKKATPEETGRGREACPEDQREGRRTDLMIWMGIGGGVALLGSAAVLNGGVGVLDALWKMVMGGVVGIVYSWESSPKRKTMPSWSGTNPRISSSETGNRTSSNSSSTGKFLPPKLKKLLRGEWPPKRTAAMFLVGACLTAIIAEGITPVADLGNSALVTIPSVLTGAMVGGIGYALNQIPSRTRRVWDEMTPGPVRKSSLKRSIQPVQPEDLRQEE